MRAIGKINLKSILRTQKNIDTLRKKIGRQTQREAIAKASTPLRKAAKSKVRRRSGALARSIKTRVRTYKRDELIIATTGVDRKATGMDVFGNVTRPRDYGFVEEFGTEHSKGHPFMRPAFDEQKDNVKKVYAKELRMALPRIARRIYKRSRTPF